MSLASDAGLDTTVCEVCEEPLNDTQAWTRGMDGCGAHLSCLGRTISKSRRAALQAEWDAEHEQKEGRTWDR